jgi:predicted aconitase
VIHFNFGLHDLRRVDANTGKNSNQATDPQQADPDTDERQLRRITAALAATGAKLILATTTPVPEGRLRPHRENGDVEIYNQRARRVMAEFGVASNDLYAAALPKLAAV